MRNPLDILNEPGEGNLAWGYMQMLFDSAPLGQAIGVFLSVLLFFGSCLIGWQILQGIIHSAYTGRVLGDKWHTIHAPLRIVLGMALITPLGVGASGELPSAATGLFRQLGIVSINLGDAVVTGFGASILKEAQPLETASVGGIDLASIVAEREVCAAFINARRDAAAQSPLPLPPVRGKDAVSGLIWSERTGTVWDYGECGSFSFSAPEGKEAFETARRDATAALVQDVRRELGEVIGPIFRTGGTALTDEASVRAVFERAVGGKEAVNGLSAWMLTRAATWDKAVVLAASAESLKVGQEERVKILAAMQTQGFLASGTFYRSLSQVSALTVGLASEAPNTTDPAVPAYLADEYASARGMLKAALRWDAAELSANDLAFAGDDESGTLTKLLAPLMRDMGEALTKGEATADPVADMMTSGHRLLTAGQAAIAAGAIGKVASDNAVVKATGFGGAIDWLLSWASYAIMISFIVGALWAYALPMIPFIMVFMMGISWMMLLLEGIIAIHIWAFALISMEGTEFFDTKQKPGLSILFNIVLRPALSMLVLCGSLVILPYTLNLLNILWGTGFYGAQGGHIVDPVGMVVALVILAWLQWQLCIRVFGMIPGVADRMGAWFGAAAGAQGYNEGGNTDALVAGMAGMALRPVQSAMSGMKSDKGKDKGKDEKDDGDDKEAGKDGKGKGAK